MRVSNEEAAVAAHVDGPNDESCCLTDATTTRRTTMNEPCELDPTIPVTQLFTDAQEECLHSQMERLKADVLLEAYATINRTFAVLMGSD